MNVLRRIAPLGLAGFAAALLFGLSAQAEAQLAPRVIILFDTSGSMTFAPDGQATHGDGSQDRPGIDTNGDGLPNDSRMFIAKEAVRDILLDSDLDIEFGLMRYHQEEGLNIRDEGPTGPRYRQPINYDGTGSCDPNTGGADVLVPVGAGNRSQILQWMDNTESYPTNKELRGSHWTPLGLSLRDARTHMSSTVIPGDSQRSCRSYYVIMITDGNPECSPAEAAGSWVTQAQNLRSTTSGGQSYDIKTFVVGFGQSVNGSEQLNLIARAGGTAVNSQGAIDLVDGQALFATDRALLRQRLQQLLTSIIPTEICDGRDNDCDSRTDEGFNTLGDSCEAGVGECRRTGSIVCAPSGTTAICSVTAGTRGTESCDGRDNDCDGTSDEGTFNVCGTCGATPNEVCDGNDNDCDGRADEGVLNACGRCGATPQETCNGVDDDCDGEFDEGLLNACGGCGATPREECDGGDNDCDGRIDEGFDARCGNCVVTGPESCDGNDNDCDAVIDEGVKNACGFCGPLPAEQCNQRDEDCDGRIDEGVQNACGTCGSVPVEVCDSQDNNCDGRVDEGVRNACNRCGALGAEVCDNVDNDCDGVIDDNVTCPIPGEVCVNGECAEPCQAGECFNGTICQDGFCVTPCNSAECPSGFVCTEGECEDPCAGIECPDGTECSLGACVEGGCEIGGCENGKVCSGGSCVADPCATTACAATQGCRDGECLDTCLGVTCQAGETCNAGRCEADPCAGRSCPFGQVCRDGQCYDDPCKEVLCGAGDTCFNGECVPDPCQRTTCPGGTTCSKGDCEVDEAVVENPDPTEDNNGPSTPGNNDGPGDPGVTPGATAGPPGEEACSCATPARDPALPFLPLVAALAAPALLWLRRR